MISKSDSTEMSDVLNCERYIRSLKSSDMSGTKSIFSAHPYTFSLQTKSVRNLHGGGDGGGGKGGG